MRTNFCCSPSFIFSSPASSAKLRLPSNSRSCQRNIKNKPTIKKLTTEYSEFDIISKICSSRKIVSHRLYSFVTSYSKGILLTF